MSGTDGKSDAGPIRRSERDGVWTLALARPPVNAADLTLARALGEAVAEAEASGACRALVIAGEGRAFCGGIDVKALPGYDAATRADFLRTITRTLAALYALPKPTIAAVHGHALGAGLVLALACDLRVAAAGDYQLGLTEIAAGVPFPAGPLVVTRAELSASLARRLVMTGEVFGPGDAAAGEIFDSIVPAAELNGQAHARALRAAGQRAYAVVKEQWKRAAIAELRALAASGDDPLLAGWI